MVAQGRDVDARAPGRLEDGVTRVAEDFPAVNRCLTYSYPFAFFILDCGIPRPAPSSIAGRERIA